MLVPGSETRSESFLWYSATPRVRFGVAYLERQKAFRALATVTALTETTRLPSLNFSAGVQGIGTGNPGYSATMEKNFRSLNLYAGLGWRSNENHMHALAGAKYSAGGFSLGIQEDGHQHSPFVTFAKGQWVAGVYIVGFRSPGYLVGVRF